MADSQAPKDDTQEGEQEIPQTLEMPSTPPEAILAAPGSPQVPLLDAGDDEDENAAPSTPPNAKAKAKAKVKPAAKTAAKTAAKQKAKAKAKALTSMKKKETNTPKSPGKNSKSRGKTQQVSW